MTTTWKTVQVFISSTFRDMQAERDHLVRFVFPRLREELLKWRIHLVAVDLRWGVIGGEDASEVCREIIDECRPRFVCILGGRYGWIPPGKVRSITDDEIHYGMIDVKESDRKNCYIYFREDATTASMEEVIPNEFREPVGSENYKKLAELKQAIISAGLKPFIYHAQWDQESRRLTGLKAFGDQVYSDLLASIRNDPVFMDRDELQGTMLPGEFAEETAAMETFVEGRCAQFILGSRETILNEIINYVDDNGGNGYLCLSGAPGSGKSALLAYLSRHLSLHQAPETILISHFAGASIGSTDIRNTLRRFCHALKSGCSTITAEIPDDPEELRLAFIDFLQQACEHKHVIILIDAINQFEPSPYSTGMIWLPQVLPRNARVIVSILDGPLVEEFRLHHPVRTIALQPLTISDGEAIVGFYLKRYRKKMERHQLDILLAKTDADKPLYLLAVLEELRTQGAFEEITRRIEELPAATQELFTWILERLENDDGFRDAEGQPVGYKLVSAFGARLCASRAGLSQRELIDLLDPHDPHGNVAALIHLLRPYLMYRGELLDFYHGQLKDAASQRYLGSDAAKQKAHQAIAGYFENQWCKPDTHALGELPYHLHEMQSWSRLAGWLTHAAYLRDYCLQFGPYHLLRYAETCLFNLENEPAQLAIVCETLGHFSALLAQEPQALLQQLYLAAYNDQDWSADLQGWADQALALSPQKRPFYVSRGVQSPPLPMFRNLGDQGDFVPEIGASPDFARLYSASMAGQLRSYDLVSGSLLSGNLKTAANALSLKVLDEKNIFIGLADGSLVKWDGNYGLSTVFQATGDYSVNALALDPERELLWIGPGQWKAQPQSGMLYILNLHTFKQVGQLDLNDRIVLAHEKTWQRMRIVNPDGAQVNQIIPRPNSTEMAFGFHHGEVALFNPDLGQWRRVHSSNAESIFGIAFNEQGDRLFFVDSAGRLVSFDLTTWSVIDRVIFPHKLTALAISTAKNLLFVGDWEGMVYWVDQDNLSIQQSFPAELRGCVRSLCCDSSGGLLAASGRNLCVLTTDAAGPSLDQNINWSWQAMRGHGSGDLRVCATTSLTDGVSRAVEVDTLRTISSASLWDIHFAKRIPLAVAEKFPGSAITIVALPGLREIAQVRISDLKIVHGLAISDQGARAACMVSTSKDVSTYLFDLKHNGKKVSSRSRFTLRTRPGRLMPMAFSPDQSLLAAVTAQCAEFSRMDAHVIEFKPVTISIWNSENGRERILSVELPVRSLAFSNSADKLFVGPGTQLEYAKDHHELMNIEARQVKNEPSKDIFAIKIFDIQSGKQLTSLSGHTDSVNALSVSNDGKYLLSVADDCTARLWDLSNSECLGLVGLSSKPLWCGFTANPGEFAVACTGWRADLRVLTKVFRIA